METQQVRTPIQNRQAMLYNYSVPKFLGGTKITTAMGTDDQAAIAVNGAAIVAEDTITNLLAQIAADGTLTIAAQPDVPRILSIGIHNDSGGPLNMYVGTFTVRVTGTFRGETQVDDIEITLADAKKAVANTKFRSFKGNKPFETVTSVIFATPAATYPAAGLKLSVGYSSCVGLPARAYGDVVTDIVSFLVDGAITATTGVYANDSVDLGTLVDGKSFTVLYWTNLSDIRRRLFGR